MGFVNGKVASDIAKISGSNGGVSLFQRVDERRFSAPTYSSNSYRVDVSADCTSGQLPDSQVSDEPEAPDTILDEQYAAAENSANKVSSSSTPDEIAVWKISVHCWPLEGRLWTYIEESAVELAQPPPTLRQH